MGSAAMVFGKPSISRLPCRGTCVKDGQREETIHKWGVCIHCNTPFKAPKPANIGGGWRHPGRRLACQ